MSKKPTTTKKAAPLNLNHPSKVLAEKIAYDPWRGKRRTKRELRAALSTLRRAEKAIEKRGWTQGTLQNRNGEVCVLGALSVADGPGETVAGKALSVLVPQSIPGWNDTPGRRKSQVMILLRRARALLEKTL